MSQKGIFLESGSIFRTGIGDRRAIAKSAAKDGGAKGGHGVVEGFSQIDGVDHHARGMEAKLFFDSSVGENEAGRIGGIPGAGVCQADPEMPCRCVGLHGLPHDLGMDRRSVLAGVVKRLKDAIDVLFF